MSEVRPERDEMFRPTSSFIRSKTSLVLMWIGIVVVGIILIFAAISSRSSQDTADRLADTNAAKIDNGERLVYMQRLGMFKLMRQCAYQQGLARVTPAVMEKSCSIDLGVQK
jgi:uncharacterized membrane protein YjgN (DUF898 family)